MCRSCPNRKTMEFHSYYLPGWTLSGAAWQQHDLQNGFAMRSLAMAEMGPDPRLFSWVPIHPQQDWGTRKITRWHQTSWFVGQPPWWVALEAIIEGAWRQMINGHGWLSKPGRGRMGYTFVHSRYSNKKAKDSTYKRDRSYKMRKTCFSYPCCVFLLFTSLLAGFLALKDLVIIASHTSSLSCWHDISQVSRVKPTNVPFNMPQFPHKRSHVAEKVNHWIMQESHLSISKSPKVGSTSLSSSKSPFQENPDPEVIVHQNPPCFPWFLDSGIPHV